VAQLRQLGEDLVPVLASMGWNVTVPPQEAAGVGDKTQGPIGKPSDAGEITAKFLQRIPVVRPSLAGFYNFKCPSCGCADGRSGFVVRADGGFRFSCFHTGCEYHTATGWSPRGGVGERTLKLYELLGGD